MTKVSIIGKGIKGLNIIKAKLEDRDALVACLNDLDELKNVQTNVLILTKSENDNDEKVITLARTLKISKVIQIDDKSKTFSLKKELGESLIKMSLIEEDHYNLEVLLSHCIDNQKFITGSSESLVLKTLAKKVANTDVTVFINGPTGTGKEVVANYVHDNSTRSDKPFVAVNCAAIPENMLEAILFGHEKGSFTGASNSNKGIFRAADNGTLLLDEISEMPLSLQAKLLRVLQERKVTPVGGTRDIDINVRIIATTNRNMVEEVKNSNFREDLYYRLNVFPIRTCDLVKRIDDIIPITVAIIKKNHEGKSDFPYLEKEAQKLIKKHTWSGNVRELENVILRALVLSNNQSISVNHIMLDDRVDLNDHYSKQFEEKILAAGN
jgi:two-component system, response regulator FlrC